MTHPGFRFMVLFPICIAAGLASAIPPSDAQERSPMPTTTEKDCCAVMELRQYTLHPFKRDVMIDVFERELIETQEAEDMRIVGTFRDLDDPDRFVWLRGFAGMPERGEALPRFYTGPAWMANREAANGTMVDSDNVLLLKPASAGSGFAVVERPLAARDAVAIPPGLVEARIYYLGAEATPEQVGQFDAIRPVLEGAGAELVAVLVTESARNNFRLPVREGEWVIAWFAQFPDMNAYERYRASLVASPQWRRFEDGLLHGAPRAPDVLRLMPTPRSRLPYFEGQQ